MAIDDMLGGNSVVRTSFIAETKGFNQAAKEMANLSRKSKDFMKSMGLDQSMPNNKFKNLNKGFYDVNQHLKQAGKHAQRFKMELLGIMFFGMGMQRIFQGAIGPAANAFGLGELWDTTKLVLFLPLMEAIFPYLLQLMTWIMDLPQPIKLLIGSFTLLIGAIGTLFALFGSISLGMTSFKLVLTGLGTTISATSLLMSVTLVGGLIAVGLWLTTTANQMGGWGNLFKNALSGVINFIIVLSGWLGTLITKTGELLSKTWIYKSVGDGLQNVGNSISSLAEDAAIGFQNMREDSTSWWNTTVQNNTAVANSFTNLAVDAEKAFRRIELAYGYAFSSQVQGAVSSAKTAKGAFELLGYVGSSSSVGKSTTAGAYKSNPNAWKPKTKMNDFVWRAGQGAVAISQDDNLIGTKKGTGGGGVTINQTINVGSAQRDEIKRMLDENNKKLASDIKRMVSA